MTFASKEELQDYLGDIFPQIKDDLVIETIGNKNVEVRLRVSEAHLRPGGTVSGPAMFTLADAGFYVAVLNELGKVPLAVTTNANIDFMRKPVAGKDIIAQVRLLKVGKILVVGDVLIRSKGQDAPVARASITYSIPPVSGVK